MSTGKYRLVTNGNFDSIVSASLFNELDLIDDIVFCHPVDIKNGNIIISKNDILINLPYNEKAHLVFEYHKTENLDTTTKISNLIFNNTKNSTSEVVYDYYGGKDTFKNIPKNLFKIVCRSNNAAFKKSSVLYPRGWDLLLFIIDPRTGLSRFKQFGVPNSEFLSNLTKYVTKYSIEKIIEQNDIKDRVELYFEHEEVYKKQVRKCSTIYERKILVTDYTNEIIIYAGNRFLIYAMYPECNISINMTLNKDKNKVIFALGKSIFNKSSKLKIGELCIKYGGGGHDNAGTFQENRDNFEHTLCDIIDYIKING